MPGVKHLFHSAKSEGANPSKVSADEWNAPHVVDILPTVSSGGMDGALHFDGSSTVLGIVPSAGVYALARCIFPSSMIVDVGVVVDTNNFRVIVSGTLTNNGHIHNDGAPAVGKVGGVAKANGFYLAASGGGAGAGTASGSGSSSASSGHAPPKPYSDGSASGGAGGVPGGQAGVSKFTGGAGGGTYVLGQGANGAAAVAEAATASPALEDLIAGRTNSRGVQLTPGCGGGGGGVIFQSNPGSRSGGGGAGGGFCTVICGRLLGTGFITANGGNGANAEVVAGGQSSSGGGGGGSGGILIVVYATNGGNAFFALGGFGGTGADNGSGINSPGGAGGPGVVVRVNLSRDGT